MGALDNSTEPTAVGAVNVHATSRRRLNFDPKPQYRHLKSDKQNLKLIP